MIGKGMCLAQVILLVSALAVEGQEPTIEPAGSFGGTLRVAAVKDTYAYVGQGAHIRVLDVSDPGNPRRVGSIETGLGVSDLYIAGTMLYSVGESQFLIADITAPANPVLKSVTVLRNAEKVFVSGAQAYIGCGSSGWKILDVANPAAPAELKEMTGRTVVDLWVQSNRAYIQEAPSSPNPAVLKIYDVTNPASPVLLGSLPEGSSDVRVRDIVLGGDSLYQAGDNGLRVVDVSDPASPQAKGMYWAPDIYISQMALNGSYLYLLAWAWNSDPLVILDVTDPDNLVKAAGKNIPNLKMIFTAPPYGYFVVNGGFDVYSLATPVNPAKQGSWQTQENTHQAVAHGSHLFVNDENAVWVYGLQNPAAPANVSAYLSIDRINQIFLADNRLYERVSTWTEEKVAIYNAADPANIDPGNPPFLGGYEPKRRMTDLFAKDNRLLLLTYEGDPWNLTGKWLEVIDLAPAGSSLQATKLADYTLPGKGVAVCLSGSVAYVAYQGDAASGVEVVNLANPSAPQKLSSITTAWAPSCVHVSGQTLWIGQNGFTTEHGATWRLEAHNMADPASPALIAATTSPGKIWGVQQFDNLVFAAIQGGSVYLYNFANNTFGVPKICHSSSTIGMTVTPPDTAGRGYVYTAEGNRYQDQEIIGYKGVIIQAYSNVAKPVLTLGAGKERKLYCPLDPVLTDDVEVLKLTLSVNEVAEWFVSAITFLGSGVNGHEVNDLEAVKLYQGDTLLSQGSYPFDNMTITLAVNRLIAAGGTIALQLKYQFKLNVLTNAPWPKEYEVQTKVDWVQAWPQTPPYANYAKLPPAPFIGGPAVVAPVWNLQTLEVFGTIQAGIDDPDTVNGHTIEVCPGHYIENVNVNKSLIIRSKLGREFTLVEAADANKTVFDLNADNCTLMGFTIRGATGGSSYGVAVNLYKVAARIMDNLIQSNRTGIGLLWCKNAEVTNNDIVGNTEVGLWISGEANWVSDNLIFNNKDNGIRIHGVTGNPTKETLICGNTIGINASWQTGLGNGIGIKIVESVYSRIGGINNWERNLISGNVNAGILIEGGKTNWILGNSIGTDETGKRALPNKHGIECSGAADGNLFGGLEPGSGNLISGNAEIGIDLGASKYNTVQGNFIGTDVTGLGALPNRDGICLRSDGRENLIGGLEPGAGNLVSGNTSSGIILYGGVYHKVQGNFIGTDKEGLGPLPNGSDGIHISGGSLSLIGGPESGAGNVISGNAFNGIELFTESSKGNQIQGNRIGVGADGRTAVKNKRAGILVSNSAHSNEIGGENPGEQNVIAYNGEGFEGGVVFFYAAGAANAILGNAIYANEGLGIDFLGPLFQIGVTPNDAGDGDPGPNQQQNFPVLQAAVSKAEWGTVIKGTLNSAANQYFTLRFFANRAADPSGHGEGERYLGRKKVQTGASGDASFTIADLAAVPPGEFLTATATDDSGNTSEFSPAVRVETAADGDFDGVADLLENGAPNNGDGNKDGILDGQQGYVVSMPDGQGQFSTWAAAAAQIISNAQRQPAAQAPAGLPAGTEQVAFQVKNVPVGGVAQVAVWRNRTENSYFNWDQALLNWKEFPYSGETGAFRQYQGWQVFLKDGGAGDSDGQANGTISHLALMGYNSSLGNTPSDLAWVSPFGYTWIQPRFAEEDTPVTVTARVGDSETDEANLTLGVASSNPTLVPQANIVPGGSGADRTLTVTPAAGQTGTATITVSVGDGTAVTQLPFTLTVTPKPGSLVTRVEPPEAAADGCKIEPARVDNVPIGNKVTVTATEAGAWNFKQWSGAASGTAKITEATVSGPGSEAVAYFVKPVLTLVGGKERKLYCPQDPAMTNEVAVLNLTLSVNEVANWWVSSIQFLGNGTNGHELNDLQMVRLYQGSTLLSQGTYISDDGRIALGVNLEIPAGGKIELTLMYQFKPARLTIPPWAKEFAVQTMVDWVNAQPQNPPYPNYAKLPPEPVLGGPLVIAPVRNINTVEGFAKIQDAINDGDTKDGHTIEVCPGTYIENVLVSKQLTVKSAKGAEATVVQAADPTKSTIDVSSDNVTIRGFTVQGAGTIEGLPAAGIIVFGSNCQLESNVIKENGHGINVAFARSCTIFLNTIQQNKRHGLWVQSADGVFVGATTIGHDSDPALGNQGSGVALDGCSNIYLGYSRANLASVFGNTIVNNAQHGISMGPHLSQGGGTIYGGDIYLGQNSVLHNGGHGVAVDTVPRVRIGGRAVGIAQQGNAIYANGQEGIWIRNTSQITIQANTIGLDKVGASYPNKGCGIKVVDSTNVLIGEPASEPGSQPGNIIGHNLKFGIQIQGTKAGAVSGVTVKGNLIGLAPNGTRAANDFGGIWLGGDEAGAVSGTWIGGGTVEDRNIISGNSGEAGIYVDENSTRTTVQGNFIGVAANGAAALGNEGCGIVILNSPNNQVGGITTTLGWPPGNLIAGNLKETDGNLFLGEGILLLGEKSINNRVEGNNIGLKQGGDELLLNGARNAGCGIRLANGPSDNQIVRNLISGNGGSGIQLGTIANGNVISANYIGVKGNGFGNRGNLKHGIHICGGSDNVVGEGNVIAGNGESGVRIELASSQGNAVSGNRIGIDEGGLEVPNQGDGITVSAAAGTTIGGQLQPGKLPGAPPGNIISWNAGAGVRLLDGAEQTVVAGNLIGTDSSGLIRRPNGGHGIAVERSFHNRLGGNSVRDRNVIAANKRSGVYLGNGASFNQVSGNLIGVGVDGLKALGNEGFGLCIMAQANQNLIGGKETGAGNLIGANQAEGVYIESNDNRFYGNTIGSSWDGQVNLGHKFAGMVIFNGQGNMIGDAEPGGGNRIAYNLGHGIALVRSSREGFTQKNWISGNAIFQNQGLGIDLMSATQGVTPNDAGDLDGAKEPNQLQNFPVLESAQAKPVWGTAVRGVLNSKPNQRYVLEFFANSQRDPSGHGEGERFLGKTPVWTDGTGSAAFTFKCWEMVATGQFITATATDEAGNTSEFSAGVPVQTIITFVDQDGDGVPDFQENGASNNGDANRDNVDDKQQGRVVSFPDSQNRYLALVAPEPSLFQDVCAVVNPSPGTVPAGVEFPVGLYQFCLTAPTVGGAVQAEFWLPLGVRVNCYYKYGPTPDQLQPHWYRFDHNASPLGAALQPAKIILDLMDGLRGDDDLKADGRILDLGAPAWDPNLLTISAIADQLTQKNTATAPIPFTISGGQVPIENLTLEVSSSNTDLVQSSEIVSGGAGPNRTVTLTPVADKYGQTTIAIDLTDGTSKVRESFELTVNDPPTATDDEIQRRTDCPLKVATAVLLANDRDNDGKTLQITAVSSPSPNGATVKLDGSWVYYVPPSGFNAADTFTYTISDGQGGAATGIVHITMQAPPATQTQNVLSLSKVPATVHMQIRLVGIPGRTYRIEAASSLTPPVVWETLGAVVAGANGVYDFVDTNAGNYPQGRYYRSVRQ